MADPTLDRDVEAAFCIHDMEMNGSPAQRAAARLVKRIMPLVEDWAAREVVQDCPAAVHAWVAFSAGTAVGLADKWKKSGTPRSTVQAALIEGFTAEIERAVKTLETHGPGQPRAGS